MNIVNANVPLTETAPGRLPCGLLRTRVYLLQHFFGVLALIINNLL